MDKDRTLLDQPVEPTLKSLCVKVWGFIAASGRRRIIRYEGTMNQDKYRELLEKHLIVELPAMTSPNGGLIFMQDNATGHTAKSVKVWMDENRIQSLTWLGQSPDFNPIENVWTEIQNCLWERR